MKMQNDIIKIAEHYNLSQQKMQLVEEMAELMVAISKFRRFAFVTRCTVSDDLQTEHLRNNIIEEIADVEIMLAQIKYLMNCQNKVEEIKKQKIERQLERIEREGEKHE